MASLYDVQDVLARYDSVVALNGLTFSIRSGERVALLGANGSGKSTLLRLLDGLLLPAAGSVSFDGYLLTEEQLTQHDFILDFRRRVGLVFQNPDVQLFNPTVFEELAFGPLQLGWPRERIRVAVSHTLDEMAIAHLRDRSPHRLSGGERKRVALASVMILDPEVLLLDEPATALDPPSQSYVLDLLASWRGTGKTVVFATHDLARLEEIADRCLIFESGQLIWDGTPLDALHDVALLERCRLLSLHRHSHAKQTPGWHPHLHEPATGE